MMNDLMWTCFALISLSVFLLALIGGQKVGPILALQPWPVWFE
jgi:hypothetical protein